MKYILMMTGTKADFDSYSRWSREDLQRNVEFMRRFSKELKDSGAFVASEGLGWPHEAKIIRAGKDGEPVTDSIIPEAKEFLAGYWIIDVENPEQAWMRKHGYRFPAGQLFGTVRVFRDELDGGLASGFARALARQVREENG